MRDELEAQRAPSDGAEPTRWYAVECPHCREAIRLRVALLDVVAPPPREAVPLRTAPAPEPKRTPSEAALIARAEKTGILGAFQEAVAQTNTSQPKDYGDFFCHFLRTMRPRQVPAHVLERFRAQYPIGYLTFYCSQGVACVAADGNIRHFVPTDLLAGEPVRKLNGRPKGGAGLTLPRLDVDMAALTDWIKTRRGYVPVDCSEYLDALKRQSLGAFDKPGVSQ